MKKKRTASLEYLSNRTILNKLFDNQFIIIPEVCLEITCVCRVNPVLCPDWCEYHQSATLTSVKYSCCYKCYNLYTLIIKNKSHSHTNSPPLILSFQESYSLHLYQDLKCEKKIPPSSTCLYPLIYEKCIFWTKLHTCMDKKAFKPSVCLAQYLHLAITKIYAKNIVIIASIFYDIKMLCRGNRRGIKIIIPSLQNFNIVKT